MHQVSVWLAIKRGLKRHCPRCGEGLLFKRWFSLNRNCSHCGLRFEPKPGDGWAFWVFGDRVFLFGALVALYFGVRPISWTGRWIFIAIVSVAIVYTMPHRQGVTVALDWLVRDRFDSEQSEQSQQEDDSQ